MIGASLRPVSVPEVLSIFFLFSLSSLFCLFVCVVEMVSDVYKPDPCAGSGGPAARKLSVEACENGGLPGMGWNGNALFIHLYSPSQ